MEESQSSITESLSKPRWMKVILIILPTWLIASGAFGLWLYFDRQNKEKLQPNVFSTSRVTHASISSDFRILCDVIGARHQRNAVEGLLRTAAMIDSALGQSNTGFDVSKYEGIPNAENAQPFLHIRLAGGEGANGETPQNWVLVPYDAPNDSVNKRGAVTASALTVALASAQLMVQQSFDQPVQFLFIPTIHSNAEDLAPTLKRLQTIVGSANGVKEMIYLGNMLHPGSMSRITIKNAPEITSNSTPIEEFEQRYVNQFPPHLEICNSLAATGYVVSALESKTQDIVTDELLDQINPPASILANHAERLREYIKTISK